MQFQSAGISQFMMFHFTVNQVSDGVSSSDDLEITKQYWYDNTENILNFARKGHSQQHTMASSTALKDTYVQRWERERTEACLH